MFDKCVYEVGDGELLLACWDSVNIEEQFFDFLYSLFIDLLALAILHFIILALVLFFLLPSSSLRLPLCE